MAEDIKSNRLQKLHSNKDGSKDNWKEKNPKARPDNGINGKNQPGEFTVICLYKEIQEK